MKFKKFIATASALLLVVISVMNMAAIPVSAAYYNTGKTFDNTEGKFLGLFGGTKYTYKIYKDSSSWYVMYHDYDVCPAIYHPKGKGTTTLTYSQSKTLSEQTAYNFSCSIGCSVGISELVNLTASATGGLTKASSCSITASGSVAQVIPSSASTGYYKMTICYNFEKFRLDKYKSGSSQIVASYYPALPVGKPYAAALYSTSTVDSTYKKY